MECGLWNFVKPFQTSCFHRSNGALKPSKQVVWTAFLLCLHTVFLTDWFSISYKRRQVALQKTAFWRVKGGLLQGRLPPFALYVNYSRQAVGISLK
jgi:hypothetical protein